MASRAHDFSRRHFHPMILLLPMNFRCQLSARLEHRMTAVRARPIFRSISPSALHHSLESKSARPWTALNPHEGRAANGFGNLELAGKYQFLKNDAHEAIASLGLGVEVGGTGSSSIGADSFSTWSPGIFFGKGFGDLPEAIRSLKPFAVTGQLGVAIPTSASTRSVTVNDETGEHELEIERHPDVLEWGCALEYSVVYLQSQVQDMHLPAPIDRLIPLVEFALETPLDRGEQGQTTGTINPGVIWAGKYFQIGA